MSLGRKKTSKPKSEATKEALYDLSMKLLKKGFDNVSMRELAREAGLSLGAFYYHFSSKEELIHVYYQHTFDDFERESLKFLETSSDFSEMLISVLQARIDTFKNHRELLIVLSRGAVDPMSSLSPFSEASTEVREKTIDLLSKVMIISKAKSDPRLVPYLPKLLWMYMMGIIFFWVYDKSENQQKTTDLIKSLTPQLIRLIGLSRFPLTGTVINPILNTLKLVMPEVKDKN